MDMIEELKRLRDPKWWKAGGIGGQDQYAGMPPAIRIIDMILKEFESGKVVIPLSEYDKLVKSYAERSI